MFQACWSLGKEDFAGIESLRRASGTAVDAMDGCAAHVFVSGEDGQPIAAGRMYPAGDALRIDKLVVCAKHASLPYEELTLRMLLYRARELPQTMIEVEPGPGVESLLPRFGFAPDKNDPRLMRCARENITWFSQCGD